MKYFNHKIIGIAMMCATVMGCTDEYDCNLQVEKPEEVANSEYLAGFDLLKSYITRDAGSPFKLMVNMAPTDFLKKDIGYSTILSNFDGLDVGGFFTPLSALKGDASYDFGGMQLVADASKEAGVALYGGTLCSNQGQRADYYNKLIQPIVIPFVPEKGKTVIFDFEGDGLGKTYGMTGGSQAVVENDPDGKSGKALHVGTDANKAAYSFPKFNVKLPEGRKLGDYVNLTIDMRIVNNDGLWGSGMKVLINGEKFAVGVNAQGFGCSSNTWNRQAVIALNTDKAPGFILPENLKSLTEFELAVGSESGGAQYYLDNIVMNYEIAAKGVTKIDFEKDALGKSYPMTNGSQSVVENGPESSGKVLHVGTAATPCNYSYPTFTVKLEKGRTLGDYTALSLDMYLIDGKGGWGSGMRVLINGQEFNCGQGPFGFGCESNKWGRDKIYITFLKEGETSGGGKIAIPNSMKNLTEIELAVGSGSGEWHAYIDNISLHWKADDTIIEKTPEEKKIIFTEELNKWIGGMVNAGGETVKVWNIIGEPLDKTVDANTFNWAEYLGEVEYVHTAVKMARDTAKVDLNLFVSNSFNQYDEMDKKADELITLVKSWEADNVTKIDGYNILLHAIYAKDAIFQKGNEDMIVKLFTKLAQTGKSIRVSDLSMMVENVDGNFIQTSKLTEDERTAATNYMAFIMKEYRKLIPVDKQFGISISSMTQTITGYKLCPWTSGYNRSGMYEGIVEGLK